LAQRLYDAAQTFWASAELTVYIVEALRTFNALTSFWRGDFVFKSNDPSLIGTQWYDLTAVANTLRPYTVTDASLFQTIEYHLLEPANLPSVPWSGSSQFSVDDILQAIARRRDELLSLTGCTQTRRLVGAAAGRTLLPDTVIDVRRLSYLPNAPGVPSVLWPADAWDEQSFNAFYTILPAGTPGTPSTYLLSTQPPLSFDVDTPPSFAGSYELITVEAGAAANPAVPSLLSIPDDWSWAVKWGALADLFSRDSLSRDPLRAEYCQRRYDMAQRLLTSAPALLALRLDNVALQIDSLRLLDLYDTSWEAQAAGTPLAAGHAGLNLVTLAPAADTNGAAGFYMLDATVVSNAPVPSVDADPVQVSRDDLDAVLGYAQHLATLKSGGAEFTATLPLLQRFLDQCAVYNSKLREFAEFTTTLLGVSARESQTNPRMEPSTVEAASGE